MIVDTSALIAILLKEEGYEQLLSALEDEPTVLPAPARVEFLRVAASERLKLETVAEELLAVLEEGGLTTVPFTEEQARIASAANAVHGQGNGRGGTLNLLDLMVYAAARDQGEPLLCTGKDFAATDLDPHPASRRW
jgi:ribonuclease VapC